MKHNLSAGRTLWGIKALPTGFIRDHAALVMLPNLNYAVFSYLELGVVNTEIAETQRHRGNIFTSLRLCVSVASALFSRAYQQLTNGGQYPPCNR